MKRLLALLLCAILLTAALPAALAADAVTIDPTANRGGGAASQSANFSTACVRNAGAGDAASGTAQRLEVVVNLNAFGSENPIYAVVLKKTDYDSYFTGGAVAGKLLDSTYFKLAVSDTGRYAMGRAQVPSASAGDVAVLPLVAPSAANDSALQGGGTVAKKEMPKATVSGIHYFDQYMLVVFSGDAGEGEAYYYKDTFYVDAGGYVRTPSYLVRYNGNDQPGDKAPLNVPSRAIQRGKGWDGAPGAMALSSQSPTLTGYAFQGWAEAADAAEAGYQPGGTYPQPEALYKAYDLYALWEALPVAFKTETLSFQEAGEASDTVVLSVPQVGVPFDSGVIYLKDESSDSTNKAYIAVEGTSLPKGLKVERVGAKGWHITGTPTEHSGGAPVRVTVQVTDPSNNTTDTIAITFEQVKKGAQNPPDLDVNTGLESRITPAEGEDGGEDGQIYGLYSVGQAAQDDATQPQPDGTGSYAADYLKKGMVYEYRPLTVGGAPYDDDGDAETPVP